MSTCILTHASWTCDLKTTRKTGQQSFVYLRPKEEDRCRELVLETSANFQSNVAIWEPGQSYQQPYEAGWEWGYKN